MNKDLNIKTTKYEIVKIEFEGEHKRDYLTGYHAIVAEYKKTVWLCRIKDSKPTLLSDGRFCVKILTSAFKAKNDTQFVLIQTTDTKGNKEFKINKKEIEL